MEGENTSDSRIRQTQTFCEKHHALSPDCAECESVSKEYFDDKLRAVALALKLDASSAMFRLFHPAANRRAYWRMRLCSHFRETIN